MELEFPWVIGERVRDLLDDTSRKMFQAVLTGRTDHIVYEDALVAAEGGHLDVLKWIVRRTESTCLWDPDVCARAALNGHMHVIRWAVFNGCEMNHAAVANAALNGHLDVLKYAAKHGYIKAYLDSQTMANAALNGHLHVLSWARDDGRFWRTSTTSASAALNGHLDVIEWLCADGCILDWRTSANAALNGHLRVLEWVRGWYRELGHRYAFDYVSAANAATNGHLRVLQWAEDNNALRSEVFYIECVFQGAAKNGHLDVLEWAHARGLLFDPDRSLCSNAAMYGHLRVVEWALKNGFGSAVVCEKAAESGMPVLSSLKMVCSSDHFGDVDFSLVETHFPALTSLDVSGLGIKDGDLVHLGHLSSLNMNFCQSITSAGLPHLTGLSSVRLVSCPGVKDKMAIEELWKTVKHVEF